MDVQLLLAFIVYVCTSSRLHINVTCLSNCSNERHLPHCDCNVKGTCVTKIVLWHLPYIRSFLTIYVGPWNSLTRSVLCSDLLIKWSMPFFGWIVLCSGREKINFALWLCNQHNLFIGKHVFVGRYRRTVKVSKISKFFQSDSTTLLYLTVQCVKKCIILMMCRSAFFVLILM